MHSKATLAVAGSLIVAAAVYLIVSSTGSTAHYFLTVEELQAMGYEAVGRSATVSGVVLGDTIVCEPSVPQVTFAVVQVPGDPEEVERAGGLAAVIEAAVNDAEASRLQVVYRDVRPDLLQHKAQAVLRGYLGQDGRFYADEVLLKCPTRYEEDLPEQSRED